MSYYVGVYEHSYALIIYIHSIKLQFIWKGLKAMKFVWIILFQSKLNDVLNIPMNDHNGFILDCHACYILGLTNNANGGGCFDDTFHNCFMLI